MATRSAAVRRKRKGSSHKQLQHSDEFNKVVDSTTADHLPSFINNWYKEALAKGVDGCVDEFRQMRTYMPSNTNAAAFNANKEKNRYRDVVCGDASRVVLRPVADQRCDYIHANYVNGSKCTNQFICTQAPLDSTAIDFWRMVWQDRVPLVVMLCNVVERGKQKCSQYWPADVGQTTTYGPFSVKNASSKVDKLSNSSSAKVTVLQVTSSADPSTHAWPVLHCHWADWPDRGVPPDSKTLIVLRRRIIQHGFPVVIHCSAGIGRTGTLTAVDLLLGALESDPPKALDVLDTVKKIRDQRMHSVQNEQQYVFIYRVIIDYISMRWKLSPSNTPGLKAFWDKHLSLQQAQR